METFTLSRFYARLVRRIQQWSKALQLQQLQPILLFVGLAGISHVAMAQHPELSKQFMAIGSKSMSYPGVTGAYWPFLFLLPALILSVLLFQAQSRIIRLKLRQTELENLLANQLKKHSLEKTQLEALQEKIFEPSKNRQHPEQIKSPVMAELYTGTGTDANHFTAPTDWTLLETPLILNTRNSTMGVAEALDVMPVSDKLIAEKEPDIRKRSPENLRWLEELETKIRPYIQSEMLNVEWMAAQVFMSERQLYRRLKALTGLTVNDYIREMRLQEARYLLENRLVDSVKKAALTVCFHDVKYFTQIFKARFGKNPSEIL